MTDLLLEDGVRRGVHGAAKGKEFSLILLAREEHPMHYGSWRLVLSAPWLDTMPGDIQKETFAGNVMESLGAQARNISGVLILPTGDPLVRAINSVFTVQDGGRAEIADIRIRQIDIRKAIILQSKSG